MEEWLMTGNTHPKSSQNLLQTLAQNSRIKLIFITCPQGKSENPFRNWLETPQNYPVTELIFNMDYIFWVNVYLHFPNSITIIMFILK